MYFPGMESRGFSEKWPRSWKSHGISVLGPKISCCLKTGKNSPCARAKICPQKAGFSAFPSH